MTQLPVAIEKYLLESGFTGTEILILRNLLDGGAMTLRELAAKTGKSTGVLDSASKKLLNKGILTKEMVNDTPKLSLGSLDALVAWVHEDSESKHISMQRREQDLKSFIQSLSVDVSRADIQHFEGLEGLEQAYEKLLEVCRGQMLHFLPVTTTEVDDPLRDFFVEYFRQRRRKNVVTRVIAHDTPLGRRYHSRDAFEWRQSLLISETEYPFAVEKVISGDYVATINHQESKAFIIRSKELAETEIGMFEAVWRQESAKQKERMGTQVLPIEKKEIELRTRMVSAAREFFLSRKSVVTFVASAAIAAGIILGFYRYTEQINLQRLREKVMSIAATGALQFDSADINQIHTFEDIKKESYRRIVQQLNLIRKQNPGVKYVYILRPTSDPYFWKFVADGDSAIFEPLTDTNNDGILNDQLPPGYLWLDKSPGDSAVARGWVTNSADEEPVIDAWGIWISGHAPIKNSKDEAVGVLGIDWNADEVGKLTRKSVAPFFSFLLLFLFFIFLRFAAHNRSLLQESLFGNSIIISRLFKNLGK